MCSELYPYYTVFRCSECKHLFAEKQNKLSRVDRHGSSIYLHSAGGMFNNAVSSPYCLYFTVNLVYDHSKLANSVPKSAEQMHSDAKADAGRFFYDDQDRSRIYRNHDRGSRRHCRLRSFAPASASKGMTIRSMTDGLAHLLGLRKPVARRKGDRGCATAGSISTCISRSITA